MVNYRRNQELLMETPTSLPVEFKPETGAVREAIANVLSGGRDLLTEPEAKAVLAAYGIPIVETRIAASADEAAVMATEIGLPVAVKVLSHDISPKSDGGGVVLDLETPREAKAAVEAMGRRIHDIRPDARIEGTRYRRWPGAPVPTS
jgi:acetyltransferase